MGQKLREGAKQRRILVSRYALQREFLGMKGEIKRMIRSFGKRPVHGSSVERCHGNVKLSESSREHFGKISLTYIGYLTRRKCPTQENGNHIGISFTSRSLRHVKDRTPLSLDMMKGKDVHFLLSFTIEN